MEIVTIIQLLHSNFLYLNYASYLQYVFIAEKQQKMNSDSKTYFYMRYPPQLYKQQPKISQATGMNLLGKPTRKLFYRVPYTSQQIQKIEQFKSFAMQHNKQLDTTDTQILRYLYSSQFNFKQALGKITTYLDWMHDPAIQTISTKARSILNEGAVYSYGRDTKNQPVVYLDLGKVRFDRYSINDYYCAINAVLNIVVEQCFVQGVVQTYLFVIDMAGKNFTSLPMEQIGQIINKLSVVYSNYLGNMLVVNTQALVRFTYAAVKIFIHEETRKKITLIGTSQVQKMSQFIDKTQLYQKYKGFNPDPFEYWPPQIPGQKKFIIQDQQTIYYSVQQNDSFFDGDGNYSNLAQKGQSSCCNGVSCTIF